MSKWIFIFLIVFAIFLGTVDFTVNNYQRFLKKDVAIAKVTEEKKIISKLPLAFKNKLPTSVLVQAPLETTTLFSRLDISTLNLAESMQTTLIQDLKKFGIIYEFSGSTTLYFQLKSALELILAPDDSVFDANNLGDYSLYFNDSKRSDMVFLLSLINERVWGFEYPREHHPLFKELTKTLVEQNQL